MSMRARVKVLFHMLLTHLPLRLFSIWRKSERSDHRKRVIEVDKVFLLNDRKPMKWSCSASLSRWSRDGCLEKLRLWQGWHRWWMYSERPDFPLPHTMLTLDNCKLPEGFIVDVNDKLGLPDEDYPIEIDEIFESASDTMDDVHEEESPDAESLSSTW